MRLLWVTLLVLVSFLACYTQEIYLLFRQPHVGDTAAITFRASRPFDFDQQKAFGGKRDLALSQYVPLYIYDPDRAESSKRKVESLIELLSELSKKDRKDQDALVQYVRKEFSLEISPDAADRLLQYQDLKTLLQGILLVEDSVLQSKIIEDSQPLKGKATVEIRYPGPVGTVAYSVGEILSLTQARQVLEKRVNQVFWQVDKGILKPALAIFSAALTPNLKYDQKENRRRIDEIIRKYPSKVVPYRAGEVLVPFRKVLNEEDILLLGASSLAGRDDIQRSIPWVFLSVVLMAAFFNLMLRRIQVARMQGELSFGSLFCLLVFSLLIFQVILRFTAFSEYAVPIALIPLLLILLNQNRATVAWATVLGATLTGLFSGGNAPMILYFVFGGLAAFFAPFRLRKRSQVLLPSLVAALLNTAMVFCLLADWQNVWSFFSHMGVNAASTKIQFAGASVMKEAGWAFAGGLAAGPLALLLLPLFELSFRTVSSLELHKWADLEQPLLKDLLNVAPGTYQHTMSVAHLAQAAAEAIHANVPLLRAGIYYHDIGKMANPGFFVENQSGGVNPHDELDPKESAEIIIRHVTDGIKAGEKARLPQVILDFIPQHHGTQLVEYFFNKAVQNAAESDVSEDDFKYPGPKPQSVEAAILMISDAVEAASRTIQEPNREAFEAIILHVIEKRVTDGQLDECRITTSDLARIRGALTDSLMARFHTRVEYPWQERKDSDLKEEQ